MMGSVHGTRRISDQAAVTHLGPDFAASLAAIGLIQAHKVAAELRGVVIPALPASQRTFPSMMAKRLERRDIFQPMFLADLETLADMLEGQISAGSHVGWEADENHTRGGYEVICYENGAALLVHAVRRLDALADAIIVAIGAAHAQRAVGDLLDA